MKIGETEHGVEWMSSKYDILFNGLGVGDSRLVTTEDGEGEEDIRRWIARLRNRFIQRKETKKYKIRLSKDKQSFRIWRLI